MRRVWSKFAYIFTLYFAFFSFYGCELKDVFNKVDKFDKKRKSPIPEDKYKKLIHEEDRLKANYMERKKVNNEMQSREYDIQSNFPSSK